MFGCVFQSGSLRQQLSAAQAELAEVLERANSSAAETDQARADRDAQALLAKEVSGNIGQNFF